AGEVYRWLGRPGATRAGGAGRARVRPAPPPLRPAPRAEAAPRAAAPELAATAPLAAVATSPLGAAAAPVSAPASAPASAPPGADAFARELTARFVAAAATGKAQLHV